MVAPKGTFTDWHWLAGAGSTSLEWSLTVLHDPGRTTYFWAHQWSFAGGDVGYFGLQAHDLRDDGSVGRLAVFSIWAAVGCADNPTCHSGTEGAPFWTCRLAYEWVTGREYRLRVASRRPGWWSATVSDLATGAETLVGSIRVPARWGGVGGFGSSSTWTEFYGANVPGGLASCDLVPYSKVRFGKPTMDGGTVAPHGHRNRLGPGECANSAVADEPAGVVHEMGIPGAGAPGLPAPQAGAARARRRWWSRRR
jgi:hypothetical protein